MTTETDEVKERTAERLCELLDQKDAEVDELADKLRRAENIIEGDGLAWARHIELPAEQTLPVPRLEMVYEPSARVGWAEYKVRYRMVYRHLLGHCVAVPMGETKISGGHSARAPIDREPGRDWADGARIRIDLPFRDGVHMRHDARHLNLPAFAIVGDVVETIPPLTPKGA